MIAASHIYHMSMIAASHVYLMSIIAASHVYDSCFTCLSRLSYRDMIDM